MAGQPWMKWYVGDWKREPRLRLLSAEARGVWMEILMTMHEEDTYKLTGTPAELALMCGVEEDEMERGLRQLHKHGVARFLSPNGHPVTGTVTVVSRKRAKEYKIKQDSRIRQHRKRNGAVPEDVDHFLFDAVSRDDSEPVTNTHALARADSDSDSKKETRNVKKGEGGSPREETALETFTRILYYNPPLYYADLIQQTVSNLPLWDALCQRWRDSEYRPANVSGLLDLYREESKAPERTTMATAHDSGMVCTVCHKSCDNLTSRLETDEDFEIVRVCDACQPEWKTARAA